MNGTPCASSIEKMVTMWGWLSAATARASRRNRARLGIRSDVGGQHFQRDVTAEASVVRAIDVAHATFAELGDDLVGTDALTRREGHCWLIADHDNPRRIR